jgi:hypothetical protein
MRRCRWLSTLAVIALVGTAASGQERAPQISPSSFFVSFVKSDRVWKNGLHKETYNEVSEFILTALTEALKSKGLNAQPIPEMARRQILIEVLEVSGSNSVYPKPNAGVAATIQVTDTQTQRVVYSKGFHGEAKSLWKPPSKGMVGSAADILVKSLLDDDHAIKAIVGIAD